MAKLVCPVLVLPLVLAGCTAGSDYRSPDIALPAAFHGSAGEAPVGDVAEHRWWQEFNDPLLTELVEAGLSQNLSIQLALARVAEAQAAARATGLPALTDGSLSGAITRMGGDAQPTATSRTAGFSPLLILDLFGAERRSREQALAQLQAAELDVGTARLAFVSALVSSYLDLRYYQEALALSRESLALRRETLSLVEQQRNAGTATDLSVAQARAALDEAEAQIPGLEQGFYASAYAIATLIGRPAQEIMPQLERGRAQPLPQGSSSGGVPADLLRNRPDIRSAERSLAAAVAALGVAEARFYPSVTLSGTITAADATSWSFGPAIQLPVLNRAVLSANRDQAMARVRQADLTWRSAVLSAVEEVQAAQSALARNRRALVARQQATESSARLVELSRQTWENGATTLLDFLESQRSLASSQLSLAGARRDMAASWASLQVAAGRGWVLQ